MADPIVVIAYRNPLEQKIWENIGENIGPIFAFFVICLGITLVVCFLIHIINKRWASNHDHKVAIPLGFIAAFAYLWFF
jgi:hypothetical protein